MSAVRPAPVAVRLLATSALVLMSGGYALWQPGLAIKPIIRKMSAPVKKPAPVAVAAVSEAAPKIAPVKPRVHVPPRAFKEAAALPSGPAYADGDFTGEPFDSDYGPIQIGVTIKDGMIVALNFLQVPDHRERSAEISAEVIPILTQEAIKAQSSRIDIVASATYTTAIFADALYNTLEKAKK